MSQQALYRKWRSRSFDELVGQPHVVQTLQNAVDSDRVAHAYLFSGPRGTGKTSTARILAKVVNCLAAPEQRPCNECHLCQAINDGSLLDLIEIDAASNTQVDKVRDVIVEKVNFAPSQARKKIYIIDEVHMLSNSAFNALLKTIEEPPPHAMFILATTEIHKIPATILSRCQRLDFRRISIDETADHLGWVLEQEGVTADREVLTLVARQATGSMRDALSLLDQLLSHGGDHLTLAQARAALGLASSEAVQGVVDYVLAQDTAGALRLVDRLLDQGADPRQFLTDLLDHLRALLLTLAGGKGLLDLPEESSARLGRQARHVEPAALVEMIRLLTLAGADLKLGLQPQLPIELALIESVLMLTQRGATPAPAPDAALAEAIFTEKPQPVRPRTTRPRAAEAVADESIPLDPAPRAVVPTLPDVPDDEPLDEFTDPIAPPADEWEEDVEEEEAPVMPSLWDYDSEETTVAEEESDYDTFEETVTLDAEAPTFDAGVSDDDASDAFEETVPAHDAEPAVSDEEASDTFEEIAPAHDVEPAALDDYTSDGAALALLEEEHFDPEPGVLAEETQLTTDRIGHPLSWWAEQWTAFTQFLTQQGDEGKRAALRLKFCEPHEVNEETLTLGFYYTLHLDKVKTPTERAVIERALSDFAGMPMRVALELVPKREATPAKTKYEAAMDDPVVREAMRLGGRLIEVNIENGH